VMSNCDGPRRRKNVVAKQPPTEGDDDVMTPDDDLKRSRDNCLDVMHDIWAAVVSHLHQPVDASSLAVFRVLFGECNSIELSCISMVQLVYKKAHRHA